MSRFLFASVEQPDVAQLDWDGVTYRCFTWRRVQQQRVEAAIFVKQADGQTVLYDQGTVRAMADVDDEFIPNPPNGWSSYPDMPRVIARGPYFIAHWIEPVPTIENGIGRAIFDVRNHAAGWQYVGTEPGIDLDSRLYDVDVIEGSASDFVLVYHPAGTDDLTFMRVRPPYAWADTEWEETHTVSDVRPRVLTVSASDTDGDVVFAWQLEDSGQQQIWCGRINASDGLDPDAAETFASVVGIPSANTSRNCSNITLCRVSAPGSLRSWAVVADLNSRVIWTRISGEDASPISPAYSVPGVALASRAWTWRKPQTLVVQPVSLDVHVLLTFKNRTSIGPNAPLDEWAQAYAFVVSLDRDSWGVGNRVHPMVVGAVMRTLPDARPGGDAPQPLGRFNVWPGDPVPPRSPFKRANHLTHVAGPPVYALGPDRKTCTIAFAGWDRLITGDQIKTITPVIGDEEDIRDPVVLPALASIRALEHYHQDPWQNARQPQDPKEPAAALDGNYKGAHHRPIAYPVEITGSLAFCGGTTQLYDGAQLVEQGFFWRPQILFTNIEEGEVSTRREYWWTATYAWTDAKGQLHRSAPATPVRRMCNNTPLADEPPGWDVFDDATRLTIRTMTLSMKDHQRYYPGASPITIEIWRTYYPGPDLDQGTPDDEPGDSHEGDEEGQFDPVTGQPAQMYIFRRVFTWNEAGTQLLEGTPRNDRMVDTIEVWDQQPDVVVSRAELLPWQLNLTTLQWSPPPPLAHVPLSIACQWQNRLFGVSPEDGRVLLYSNPVVPTQGLNAIVPEFIASGEFRIDEYGEITAMAPMDRSLILFTRDTILLVAGQPSTPAGTGANLDVQVLARGTGCIEPRSVVYGPMGVFFQSAKGYYLLNRGGELDFASAGSAVEDLLRASGNVRGAVLLEDRHQIRLTLDDAPGETATDIRPRVAIYDYEKRLWALVVMPRLTLRPGDQGMQASTWWRGREGETCHVVAQHTGVAVERGFRDSTFADDAHDGVTIGTVPIAADVRTEWISVAGFAGFSRIRKIGVQIDALQSSEVTIEILYDWRGDYDETQPPHVTRSRVPKDGYIPVRLRQQKVSAIMVRVYESGTIPQTENLRITGIVIEVGIRKGPRRVSHRRRARGI